MTIATNPAATASTPSTPAADPPASAKPAVSRAQALADRLNGKVSAPPAADPPASDTPSADGTPPAADPPASSRDNTKLSQALHKATTAERQALEHKSAREKAESRVKELETQVAEFEAARKDINKLLQYGNVNAETLAEKFLKRELNFTPTPDAPPAPELPEEVKREIEYARSKRQQEESEAARKAAEDARASDLQTIGEQLAPLAETYPLVAALPGASERLLDAVLLAAEANGGELPADFDFAAMVKGANEAVAQELKAVAGSDAALKALVEDEAIAAKLRALLGAPGPAARAKVNPPALSARNTSAVPSTKKGWDAAAAAARINSMG